MPPIPIKLGGTGAATLAAAKTALGITSTTAIPAPTTTTLGGVFSKAATTGQFVTGIDTAGNALVATPVIPAPTSTTLGGVKSATAPTGQVQTGVDTTGSPTFAAPPAGLTPTFTGDVTNGAGTTTLTLASVTAAATVGSAGVSVGVQVDAKGRVVSLTAYDSAALMDSKDNASAAAAANTAINASVASVRWSARVDITVNNSAGVTEASSGYAVTGGCYFPSSNAIVFATRGLQYVRGNGSVFNASY